MIPEREPWAGRLRAVLARPATGRLAEGALLLLSFAALAHAFGPLAGAVPVAILGALLLARGQSAQPAGRDDGGAADRAVIRLLQGALGPDAAGRSRTAAFALRIDNLDDLRAVLGRTGLDRLQSAVLDRLTGALRAGDAVAAQDEGAFSVALAPTGRIDLESAVQIAARLQSALAAPFAVDGATVHVSAAVGFCLATRAPRPDPAAVLAAAHLAAAEAQRSGPGQIRAFSAGTGALPAADIPDDEIAEALETGQIVAHFQPQISTDTGRVTGFEALARWNHPARGTLVPADFLGRIQAAGLSARLTEVMLFHALTALRAWDRAGFSVPSVAVNFSREDLRDPRLPERIRWELDRFDVPSGRLTVEVLENVAAQPEDDTVAQNLSAIGRMGCGIDLDDFGTGSASIASIRRFSVRRLKIDRSFVLRSASDPEQQRAISAILALADRLGVETLAEGVETPAEHALLAQLGCAYVQGHAIGHPMPFAETIAWMDRHYAGLAAPPEVGRRAG
ncbi:MAG: EAL domain-containing protein [Rhodobacteraceae bacterium]|nr:EAL domain-containing protein [Paracoccaceae bacterium]